MLDDNDLMRDAKAIAAKHLKHAQNYDAAIELGDLAHTAALAALDARPRYNPETGATERTFLNRRMEGAILDLLRRTHTRRIDAAELEQHQVEALASVVKSDIVKALCLLDARQLQIVTLLFYGSFTLREVASIMQCAASTVVSQRDKAIEKIKHALGRSL